MMLFSAGFLKSLKSCCSTVISFDSPAALHVESCGVDGLHVDVVGVDVVLERALLAESSL
jgi:hypothetical protein